jgi:hypothetical protein
MAIAEQAAADGARQRLADDERAAAANDASQAILDGLKAGQDE